jgi:putative copper export protein
VNLGIWDAAAVLVKTVLYAATLGAAGGVFFLAYTRSLLEPSDRLAIGRLVCSLAAAAIAASAARVLVTAASMSEDAAGMLDARLLAMVWHGGEGRAAAMRAGGLLLAIPALLRDGRSVWRDGRSGLRDGRSGLRDGRSGLRDGRSGWPAIIGAAVAATSFACVGHARAAVQAATPLLLGVHVVAVAFWVGALGPLAIQVRRREPPELGAVAARFGRIAMVVVGVLLASGAVVLWILLGSVSELWGSGYGCLACVKIAFVACLLALAAWNKLRLVPRIVAGDPSAVRSLRRTIHAEMVVAGLILLTTAVLTTLAGPPTIS